GGIDKPHLFDSAARINLTFHPAIQFGRLGRQNLNDKVRRAPRALGGKDSSPHSGDVIQIGLANVQISELDVGRGDMYRAQRVLFQVAPEDEMQVAEDVLVKAVGRWRHVKISFDELVIGWPFGQLPVVPGGQRARSALQHGRRSIGHKYYLESATDAARAEALR